MGLQAKRLFASNTWKLTRGSIVKWIMANVIFTRIRSSGYRSVQPSQSSSRSYPNSVSSTQSLHNTWILWITNKPSCMRYWMRDCQHTDMEPTTFLRFSTGSSNRGDVWIPFCATTSSWSSLVNNFTRGKNWRKNYPLTTKFWPHLPPRNLVNKRFLHVNVIIYFALWATRTSKWCGKDIATSETKYTCVISTDNVVAVNFLKFIAYLAVTLFCWFQLNGVGPLQNSIWRSLRSGYPKFSGSRNMQKATNML